MASEPGRLRSLEANAPNLFLVGAALYAVFVASEILATYTGTSLPQAELFASVATVLVPLGLLGLYSVLAERRPYLSRAAAVLVVIAAVCWSIVVVGAGILEPTGVLTGPPGPLVLTPFVGMATLYLGYALFGISALLADVHPKAVGVLLLVAAVSVPLVRIVLTGLPSFVANVVNLAAYLGIGIVLLNTDVPTDGVETPTDPTA